MNAKKQNSDRDELKKYIGDYQLIKKIGEGSYAKIYKTKKNDSEIFYVLKNIPISDEDKTAMNDLINESNILSSCDNEYILKYYDSFVYKGTFNIITEFCPYGDLFGYIKFYKERKSKIEEKIIWQIFIQLSVGLNYLHSKKILHRDIKTKNIFIKDNLSIKIGDFGIAKLLNGTSSYAHTFIGTPYYISPELCKDQPYNDKSDVWALGVVLYELATLNHPFEGVTQVEIYEKIIKEKFRAISSEYSDDLRHMIDLLLDKNEHTRPKVRDILNMNIIQNMAKIFNIKLYLENTSENEKLNINTNKIPITKFIKEKPQKNANYIELAKHNKKLVSNSSLNSKNNIVKLPKKIEIFKSHISPKHYQKNEYKFIKSVKSKKENSINSAKEVHLIKNNEKIIPKTIQIEWDEIKCDKDANTIVELANEKKNNSKRRNSGSRSSLDKITENLLNQNKLNKNLYDKNKLDYVNSYRKKIVQGNLNIVKPSSQNINLENSNKKKINFDFTLEKIKPQVFSNSFTLEQNKENVEIFFDEIPLKNKSKNALINETLKLKKLYNDKREQIKKYEKEMMTISQNGFENVIKIYRSIEKNNDDSNADICLITDKIQEYINNNLSKEIKSENSENLIKKFKKALFNYIYYEIEIENIETQINKRKIDNPEENNNDLNKLNIIKISDKNFIKGNFHFQSLLSLKNKYSLMKRSKTVDIQKFNN